MSLQPTLRCLWATSLLTMLACTHAGAHEFWADLTLKAGVVQTRLFVGEGFVAQTEYPRSKDHLARFDWFGPSGPAGPVLGIAGGVPAGRFEPKRTGLHTVVYESAGADITLPADRFEAHLREDGLEHVSAWRRRKGRSRSPAQERYYRSVKALLQVGAVQLSDADRARGLPLEWVILDPPAEWRTDRAIRFVLLHNGTPHAGALAIAHTKSGRLVRGRTDAKGQVLLTLPNNGKWLLGAVLMSRTGSPRAPVWRSDWASVTFNIR